MSGRRTLGTFGILAVMGAAAAVVVKKFRGSHEPSEGAATQIEDQLDALDAAARTAAPPRLGADAHRAVPRNLTK